MLKIMYNNMEHRVWDKYVQKSVQLSYVSNQHTSGVPGRQLLPLFPNDLFSPSISTPPVLLHFRKKKVRQFELYRLPLFHLT